jgi:formate dehydrogenase major subunit
MGTDLGCPTPADAMAECASLTPTFAGISHARLDQSGPLQFHYNSGSMSRRTSNLDLDPREPLDLHPDDATRLCLAEGELVDVTSRRGRVTFPVHVTDTVAPGQVFTTFAFPDHPTNTLTSDHADTTTGCPEYKVTAVALRPATGLQVKT